MNSVSPAATPSRARPAASSARVTWRPVWRTWLALATRRHISSAPLMVRFARSSIAYFQFQQIRIDAELGGPVQVSPGSVIAIDRKRALDAAAHVLRAVDGDGAPHVTVQAASRVEIAALARQLIQQQQAVRVLRGAGEAGVISARQEFRAEAARQVAIGRYRVGDAGAGAHGGV